MSDVCEICVDGHVDIDIYRYIDRYVHIVSIFMYGYVYARIGRPVVSEVCEICQGRHIYQKRHYIKRDLHISK